MSTRYGPIQASRFWYWVTLTVALVPFALAVVINAWSMFVSSVGPNHVGLSWGGLRLVDVFGHGDLYLVGITTTAIAILGLIAAETARPNQGAFVALGGGTGIYLMILILIWSTNQTAPPPNDVNAEVSAGALFLAVVLSVSCDYLARKGKA